MNMPIKIFVLFSFFLNITIYANSNGSRATLHSIITPVTLSDGHQYDTKDDQNRSMDCLKIIPNPNGGFMGVYHHYVGGFPNVFIATSPDLFTWTVASNLAFNGSQPTIKESIDGGYLVAWEQEPNNHLKIAHFLTVSDLLTNQPNQSFDCPQTLSVCAEGTPNIYYTVLDSIEIGFHFYDDCLVDRQAQGTLTDFSNWTANPLPLYDNAILTSGVVGNIGDRDEFEFETYDFSLIEGQFINGDFGSWRTFIYDHQTGNAEQLQIVTHNSSTAFANPTITFMEVNGRDAMVITLFMPTEGAAPGEAGQLVYYSYTDDLVSNNKSKSSIKELVIFPNPVKEVLLVESKFNQTNNGFKIIDPIGKIVLNGLIKKHFNQINISSLSPGLYKFVCNGEVKSFIKK